ncbi:hypothetical protein [Lihuaxuella thermophila]|uniref:Uncharacterized protein n=1 Tax=Lihuaxuella thermophila TaxID=1173111 RepID=A0A1H8I2Z2_9BACL|nr:hypothetical protein [Lihuaxuella thermophila]SEN62933.1 hypothetical protein SAMN05444955_1162 [Lihuaxuella thermophila]
MTKRVLISVGSGLAGFVVINFLAIAFGVLYNPITDLLLAVFTYGLAGYAGGRANPRPYVTAAIVGAVFSLLNILIASIFEVKFATSFFDFISVISMTIIITLLGALLAHRPWIRKNSPSL